MLDKAEQLNSITHFIGFILSIIGTVFYLYFGILYGSLSQLLSMSVFGSSLILLYLFSTFYHFAPKDTLRKHVFQKLDHAGILLLIAGTYTPFLIMTMKGDWCWVILAINWTLAIVGIVLEVTGIVKSKKFFLTLYIFMGWIAVFFIKAIITSVPLLSLWLLVLGGLFYTVGVFFYVKKDKPFSHVIWHVFVLLGSFFHYFFILSLFFLKSR